MSDLLALNRDSIPGQISARTYYAETYEQWTRIVEDAVDHIARRFSETASRRQERDEDDITIDVVESLSSMGFRATHDEYINGHCDIVVRNGSFVWLGEAKVHTAYDALLEGYRQIVHRYSTGIHEQSVGGLLIYIKAANAKRVMERWADHFQKECPEALTTACDRQPLALVSKVSHPGTGLDFKLRHVPFPLFHGPTDKSARAAKK